VAVPIPENDVAAHKQREKPWRQGDAGTLCTRRAFQPRTFTTLCVKGGRKPSSRVHISGDVAL